MASKSRKTWSSIFKCKKKRSIICQTVFSPNECGFTSPEILVVIFCSAGNWVPLKKHS